MAIGLRRPNDARARPSSLLKRGQEYDQVFNRNYPIELYLNCALLMKRVDQMVASDAAGLDRKDQTNVRFYVATDTACTAAGKTDPTPQDIAAIPASAIPDSAISEALGRVLRLYQSLGPTDQTAKGTELVDALTAELAGRLAGNSATHVSSNG
jgi:hypothetical protein